MLILVFFCGKVSFAQVSNTATNDLGPTEQISFEKKIEGTYEIIILDPKIQEIFTYDFLKIIEEKREEDRDVIYDVSQYTRFLIYSRSKINSPEFIKNKTSK
jgi:hypothetical protein